MAPFFVSGMIRIIRSGFIITQIGSKDLINAYPIVYIPLSRYGWPRGGHIYDLQKK
ncbi:MAG: hypothetical protein GWN30_13585 [Gammaproteobacteria bacterium]|nr:hypothetical protein [Gammaproteobacteria bacterium]